MDYGEVIYNDVGIKGILISGTYAYFGKLNGKCISGLLISDKVYYTRGYMVISEV